MKSITIQLEYDETTIQASQNIEKLLEEQLSGTDFRLVSISPSSEHNTTNVIKDRDSTGAGGQTSPDNEKPPNRN
ncbi:hypothetical protein [Fictibacillus norfolkensis]|uniref:Uncharacterized protein n=1 Tax=Fictibacillus norfolkensis TaxID=2762233 RepID=A0ABR8SJK5_9BACL|nr:hypothetical protein [Fictibacillus norfolkensis]MBD7963650.1 hypothetical protein [Fictibacillus norfolkensis]